MKRTFTTLVVLFTTIGASIAQTPVTAIKSVQAFGKIDKADLELKECDFEKDANAMVLFDKGDVYYDNNLNVILDRHKRIKIFNESGKSEADIRIEYYSGGNYEYLTGLQAQVINLNNGKVEITKVDKKQIFTQAVDKNRSAMVFSFPNIKPGSVIEYSYRKQTNSFYRLPGWSFQAKIPVRYSTFTTTVPEYFYFRRQSHVYMPWAKLTNSTESRSIGSTPFNEETNTYALANVPSLNDEPYMRSFTDNVQNIHLQLVSIKPTGGFVRTYSDTWTKVGEELSEDEDFGAQLRRKLASEETIVSKAKAFKTDDEKIAYVFNEVKTAMKWDGNDIWYTNEGTVKAWDKKIGNSTEINLILFHLLKQAGVKSYPMVVSTRDNGRVNPAFSSLGQFNRAVVYIPVDSTHRYILDASNKYNCYRETPDGLLNTFGLWVDKENQKYDLVFLEGDAPVKKTVFVNAEISANGQMSGTAQIGNFSLNRINILDKYKTDGEKKYIDYLRGGNNSLTISSLKLANMEVDTLPLTEDINFKLDLAGSDKDYIYFKPNLFTTLHVNPFLSENRSTDVDFGHLNAYSVSAMFKVPAGYKSEGLLPSVSIVMPDKSMTFRRMVAEQEGTILVRYSISQSKTLYSKEDYGDLRAFYKKMYELLNDQVVLKKG